MNPGTTKKEVIVVVVGPCKPFQADQSAYRVELQLRRHGVTEICRGSDLRLNPDDVAFVTSTSRSKDTDRMAKILASGPHEVLVLEGIEASSAAKAVQATNGDVAFFTTSTEERDEALERWMPGIRKWLVSEGRIVEAPASAESADAKEPNHEANEAA